jgi:hypothetical protein
MKEMMKKSSKGSLKETGGEYGAAPINKADLFNS